MLSPGPRFAARVKTFVCSHAGQQKHDMYNSGVAAVARFARARFQEGTRGLLQIDRVATKTRAANATARKNTESALSRMLTTPTRNRDFSVVIIFFTFPMFLFSQFSVFFSNIYNNSKMLSKCSPGDPLKS